MSIRVARGALWVMAALAMCPLTAEAQAEVVTPLAQLPHGWDPTLVGHPEALEALAPLYPALTAIDPETHEVVPGLAEAWMAEPDGLRWTFTLRADARWSNGEPVTMEEVVDRWLQVINPRRQSPHAWRLAAIDGVTALRDTDSRWSPRRKPPTFPGVEVPDPQVLQIELARPEPELPRLLAHPALSPLRTEKTRRARLRAKAHTGPPEIVAGGHRVRLTTPTTIVLAPLEGGAPGPHLRFEQRVGPAPLPVEGVQAVRVHTPISEAAHQALSLAIDRDVVVELLEGAAAPVWSLSSDEIAPAADEIGDFDPRRARALLAHGEVRQISIYFEGGPAMSWLAESLAKMWRRHLAVSVGVYEGTWGVEAEGAPGHVVMSLRPEALRPPVAATELLPSSTWWAGGRPWPDDGFHEALFERAIVEPDGPLRRALVRQMWVRMGRGPWLPLCRWGEP